jgi:predicted dehydrogenase
MPESPGGPGSPRREEGSIPSIGVGLLGYAFMGKAHVNAYRTLSYMMWPPPLIPELIMVAGRDESAVSEAARRYGFRGYTTDWRQLVADERISLFDNIGPNSMHSEPTVAAAEAGKHILCEKPLGRTADESYQIWQRVAATGVRHMCAFNYRFVPAVRLARELIELGELGEIRHFRASYLQDWLVEQHSPMVWRLDRAAAGSGALGDLGSHVVDLAHYLVGGVASVMGVTRTFVGDRPGGRVDVDDAFAAAVEFENGGIGTFEASRFAPGRKNALSFEINGSKGSLAFDLERINELQLNLGAGTYQRTGGFRTVLVSETDHPFMSNWWPPGHTIGWEHTFVHEIYHLLGAIAGDSEVEPHGASLRDGYRAAEVCEAIAESAESGIRSSINYRELTAVAQPSAQSGSPA